MTLWLHFHRKYLDRGEFDIYFIKYNIFTYNIEIINKLHKLQRHTTQIASNLGSKIIRYLIFVRRQEGGSLVQCDFKEFLVRKKSSID